MEQQKLDEYRKRVYNDKIECIKVLVRIKPQKTVVVLLDKDQREFTFKLEKEVTKTKTNSEGLEIVESVTEPVKEADLNTGLPEVFKQISDYLKENASITLNISYSQSALEFDGEIVVYRFMYKGDMETLYSESIHKKTDRLDKMKERQAKYEESKKGKEVDI
jgi:hypothetical protein